MSTLELQEEEQLFFYSFYRPEKLTYFDKVLALSFAVPRYPSTKPISKHDQPVKAKRKLPRGRKIQPVMLPDYDKTGSLFKFISNSANQGFTFVDNNFFAKYINLDGLAPNILQLPVELANQYTKSMHLPPDATAHPNVAPKVLSSSQTNLVSNVNTQRSILRLTQSHASLHTANMVAEDRDRTSQFNYSGYTSFRSFDPFIFVAAKSDMALYQETTLYT